MFKQMFQLCTLLYIVTFTLSCKTTNKTIDSQVTQMPEVIIEEEDLDTLVVTASKEVKEPVYELEVYRASATRAFDLIHTKLYISFDWEKQHVLGKAYLTLRPYFYETDSLVLDAKVFDIHAIKLDGAELSYTYDQQKLFIDLGRTFKRDEEIEIFIDYTAKSNEGPSGGSAAITSDKGLFFINPTKENKFKPQQIWTQGETENNSRWFPTIDKPNERCSQEVFITVENKFKTLSNGKLVSSKNGPNGMRTDYWKQEAAHAPYLFMLGIGEYAIVEDKWNNIPLMYYVEPAYEKDAKYIFNHTPEMLSFFSDVLQYPYPWDKYAQIVCRDYVSGAMENTGAVVFGEFVQKTQRELLDSHNDDIVAHEMFHHWFGDLVTCESWSNLTLNEGFATYSEYLWREHKYGPTNAERKRIEDLNGYLMTVSQGGTHDLIDFGYDDKEQMFDGHSYNKGGLIVHMLRKYVGDEAFFASLNKYLTDNAYTDVEAHELRLAFEDTTGKDLNWFFNQWFYDQGHPILNVDYNIDAETKTILYTVEQTQDPEDFPAIFQFPVQTALYYPSGKVEFVDLWIDQRSQEFVIDIDGDEMPAAAVFDGTHDLLAIINEHQSEAEWLTIFESTTEFEDKFRAIKNLKGTPKFDAVLDVAIKDPNTEVRSLVISALDAVKHKKMLNDWALNDSDSKIRSQALKKLDDVTLAKRAIKVDKSYQVMGTAIDIVYKKDTQEAIDLIQNIDSNAYGPLIPTISEIYANTKDDSYLGFFEDNIHGLSIYEFFGYMNHYSKLALQSQSTERILSTAKVLEGIASESSNSYFKKYATANLINRLFDKWNTSSDENGQKLAMQLEEMMISIVNGSTDKRLKSGFSQFVQP